MLGQRARRVLLLNHQTRTARHTSAWPSRAAARTAIFDFIEGWYNLHRLHSSLGYLSPAEYETALAA
ncbi:IS3 family transposase [Streptomyces sp. LN500]|uniref:IS3 family transposase n=1 Tax=Streptomyces sp. LN500 TaxID=3112978 RepID=UPI0037203C02